VTASTRSRSPLLGRLDLVVVASRHDQIPGPGFVAVRDGDRHRAGDEPEADEVVADAAGQLPALAVAGGHEEHVGAAGGQGDVVGDSGVGHLLRGAAPDAGVLVVVGQDRGVAVAEPQARGPLPLLAEPDRLRQADVAEAAGEQAHPAAAGDGLQLHSVPGQDHLPAAVPG
jgi:hypothetical protein